jgi:hypothetical protein
MVKDKETKETFGLSDPITTVLAELCSADGLALYPGMKGTVSLKQLIGTHDTG